MAGLLTNTGETILKPGITHLAVDLDGTLLDSSGRLPPEHIAAIRRAQAAGIQVLLATGKTRQSALAIIAELQLETPGVFTQGMVIYDGRGQVLRQISFDPDLAAEILRFLEHRELPYIAYCAQGLLAPWPGDYIDVNFMKYGEPEPRITGQLSPNSGVVHINKLLVGDGTRMSALRQELAGRFGRQARILQAIPEFVEILPPGASKGAGLHWLLERLGIPAANLAAIGDGENDIEMLRMAGIGVAMGNAGQAVQAAADFVVAANDQGGVTEAVDTLIIPHAASG